MKRALLLTLGTVLCLIIAGSAARADVEKFFPTMDAWEPEGDPEIYTADNLFEYIDGSADLYLTYDFKELGTSSYYDAQGRGLTVEIYELGDDANGFGIYSQERPNPMKAVEVGAQGYYDYGVLNFCQGNYYVKLLGYELEEYDEDMLTAVAKIISANIGGKKKLPEVLSCFPSEAKVSGTERYIGKNVFGHGFLHSAFVADYRSGGSTTTPAFIIAGKDGADADAMLESYLNYVKDKGATVADDSGMISFEDPAPRSAGTVTLKKSGSYIWGVSTGAESAAAAYIAGVEKNLKAAGLIQ